MPAQYGFRHHPLCNFDEDDDGFVSQKKISCSTHKKGKKDPNTSLVMATVNAKMVVGAEGASLISLVRVPSHQT